MLASSTVLNKWRCCCVAFPVSEAPPTFYTLHCLSQYVCCCLLLLYSTWRNVGTLVTFVAWLSPNNLRYSMYAFVCEYALMCVCAFALLWKREDAMRASTAMSTIVNASLVKNIYPCAQISTYIHVHAYNNSEINNILLLYLCGHKVLPKTVVDNKLHVDNMCIYT